MAHGHAPQHPSPSPTAPPPETLSVWNVAVALARAPDTGPDVLAQILSAWPHESLAAEVARHPNATPALLERCRAWDADERVRRHLRDRGLILDAEHRELEVRFGAAAAAREAIRKAPTGDRARLLAIGLERWPEGAHIADWVLGHSFHDGWTTEDWAPLLSCRHAPVRDATILALAEGSGAGMDSLPIVERVRRTR